MPHYEAKNEKRSSKDLNLQLANIIGASSEPYVTPPQSVLKPEKGQVVPARSRKFIAFQTPGATKHGQLRIKSASGEGKGTQWASPSCLATAIDGMIHVPIINGSDTTLRWKNLCGNLNAIPGKRATFDDQPNEEMLGILANIEPGDSQPNGEVPEILADIESDWCKNLEDEFEINSEENYQAKLCEKNNAFLFFALGKTYDGYFGALIRIAWQDKDFIYHPP